MNLTRPSILATSWLDSLSAASPVHGYAILAQANQLQSCPLWRRYMQLKVLKEKI